MASKKTRKRAYTPPPAEVVNRKQRSQRLNGSKAQSSARKERLESRTVTLPNGRRMPIPPVPSWRRSFRQLPIYFLLLLVVSYLTAKFPPGTSLMQKGALSVWAAAPVTVFMLPMLHLMDRMRWNRYVKLTSGNASDSGKSKA